MDEINAEDNLFGLVHWDALAGREDLDALGPRALPRG